MNIPFYKEVDDFLSSQISSGLHRSLTPIISRDGPYITTPKGSFLSFASNDYLGLSFHPDVVFAFCNSATEHGVGSGGSRLICGTLSPHTKLEKELSLFKGTERSLIFSSGYLANLCALTSFSDSNTVIFSDERNHASIVDACRLSKASVCIYHHLDPVHLRQCVLSFPKETKKIIVTDSIFSTDGAVAPLEEIQDISDCFSALLIVDEAHATGIFGRNGSGLCSSLNISPDLHVSTLSKAFGLSGGFISCSKIFAENIINKGRGFIYTTAPSPPISSAALKSLEIISSSRGIKLREQLFSNIEYFTSGLENLGIPFDRYSHIISIPFGDPHISIKASSFLSKRNIFVLPFRPPTVSRGKSLLRIAISSIHDHFHLDSAIEAFSALKKEPDIF